MSNSSNLEEVFRENNIDPADIIFIVNFIKQENMSPQLVMRRIKAFDKIKEKTEEKVETEKKKNEHLTKELNLRISENEALKEKFNEANSRLAELGQEVKKIDEEKVFLASKSEVLDSEVETLRQQLMMMVQEGGFPSEEQIVEIHNTVSDAISTIINGLKLISVEYEEFMTLFLPLIDELSLAVSDPENYEFNVEDFETLVNEFVNQFNTEQEELRGTKTTPLTQTSNVTNVQEKEHETKPSAQMVQTEKEVSVKEIVKEPVRTYDESPSAPIPQKIPESKPTETVKESPQPTPVEPDKEKVKKPVKTFDESPSAPTPQKVPSAGIPEKTKPESEKQIEEKVEEKQQETSIEEQQSTPTQDPEPTKTVEVSTEGWIKPSEYLAHRRKRQEAKNKDDSPEPMVNSETDVAKDAKEMEKETVTKAKAVPNETSSTINEKKKEEKQEEAKKAKPKETSKPKPTVDDNTKKVLSLFIEFINESTTNKNFHNRISSICDMDEAYEVLGSLGLSQVYAFVGKPLDKKKELINLLKKWSNEGVPR